MAVMKTFLVLGVLLIFSLAHAQERQFLDCGDWTGIMTKGGDITDAAKYFYMIGFMKGVGATAAAGDR